MQLKAVVYRLQMNVPPPATKVRTGHEITINRMGREVETVHVSCV